VNPERMEKDIVYVQVLDALQKADDCGLCELEAVVVQRYLDSVLYEHVNDVKVRTDLIQSRGYCPRHAHHLLTFEDGLGTAILYQDQVKGFLRFLEGLQGISVKRLKRFDPGQWKPEQPCPVCRTQMQSRETYLITFVEWLDDPAMKAALEDGAGLCVQHLLLSIAYTKDENAKRYLIGLHREKFSKLMIDLKEFIRKNDYRFIQDISGQEGNSWIRSIKMMVGLRDIF